MTYNHGHVSLILKNPHLINWPKIIIQYLSCLSWLISLGSPSIPGVSNSFLSISSKTFGITFLTSSFNESTLSEVTSGFPCQIWWLFLRPHSWSVCRLWQCRSPSSWILFPLGFCDISLSCFLSYLPDHSSISFAGPSWKYHPFDHRGPLFSSLPI